MSKNNGLFAVLAVAGLMWMVLPVYAQTATDTSAVSPTATPTETSVLNATDTDTPASVESATDTPTQTWTLTPSPTNSLTMTSTVTATLTGCSKIAVDCFNYYLTPVQSGTTSSGAMWINQPLEIEGICSDITLETVSCSAVLDNYMSNFPLGIVFNNLATEIKGVELYTGGILVGTAPFNPSGFSFTNLGLEVRNTGYFDVRYKFSSIAQGRITTILNSYGTNRFLYVSNTRDCSGNNGMSLPLTLSALTVQYNGPTMTSTPTRTWSVTPTNTWYASTMTETMTLTLTGTPTVSSTPTPTSTSTPTATETPSNPATALPTATSTVTGCSKVVNSNRTLPANPVSAGVTVVGFSFNGNSPVPQGFCVDTRMTGVTFSTSYTGNLASEILDVQLYCGTTMIGDCSFGSGFSISGFAGFPYGPYDLKYVFSNDASGVVQTTLQNATGYHYFAYYPWQVAGAPLTVGNPTSTPTRTNTPTYTSTPTLTYTWTYTPTSTSTPTATETPSNPATALPTATSTATGCSKVVNSNRTLPANPVSAGVTVVGFSFNGNSPVMQGFCVDTRMTGVTFSTSFTGNLASEILDVQLYCGTTILGDCSFGSGFSISGFTGFPYGPYDLKYVFSNDASGVVQTTLQNATGYNYMAIYPYLVAGAPLTVGNPTSTPTRTNTPTRTYTPVADPGTSTPTKTYTFSPTMTKTLTNTNTKTPTPIRTNTPTRTYTPVADPGTSTPTKTYTFSPTMTKTWTNTTTKTPTPTRTNTPTRTYTPVADPGTSTPTKSKTPTPTATFTRTATKVWTPTPSFTPTWTESATKTNTPTPLPTKTTTMSTSLSGVVSYPNPSMDGTANLSYEVSGSSSSAAQALLGGDSNGSGGYDSEASITLRIYTRSGRLLWTHRIQGVKSGSNSYHWVGRDVKNAPLANGLYLYTATLEKNGVTQTKSRAILIMK